MWTHECRFSKTLIRPHVHALYVLLSPPIFIHKEEHGEAGGRRGGAKTQPNLYERARHASAENVSLGDAFIVKMHQRSSQHICHKVKCSSCTTLVWFVWLANERKKELWGRALSPSDFSFFSWPVSVLNLLKVRTQRPLSAGQPTLQMARGSEAVSTLKRAKSRGFSPAGEDTAWMGYFHQPL